MINESNLNNEHGELVYHGGLSYFINADMSVDYGKPCVGGYENCDTYYSTNLDDAISFINDSESW